MKRVIEWHFPLPRPHTGVLIGNGLQGLMVWGARTLNVTVARAGFWDHRGANPVLARTTFRDVRRLLEADDEAGLQALFGVVGRPVGDLEHPHQYGGGRFEVSFAGGFRPYAARLKLRDATLAIELRDGQGQKATLRLVQDMEDEVAWLIWDEAAHGPAGVELRSVWDCIGEQLAPLGLEAPRRWGDAAGGGFVQALPADDPLAVAWENRGGAIAMATALGPDAEVAVRQRLAAADPRKAAARSHRWWKGYWAAVPRVQLPDEDLQFAYDYGVYKQAGFSTPGAVAATLQGPWMEECQIPPWSNDYHFNINVQLCYGPSYPTNRLEHLAPLWAMVRAWIPRLREYGEHFFGAREALMLPHAVDDRCQVIGAFWSGTIDHACTAWVAQMAWLHYRYSMDRDVLRELAWPLMNGAFNGFWAMLEEVEENGGLRLSLPVSVSPEFSAGGMKGTWGRDSSFQLAAVHMLAQLLPQAAQVLGEAEDPRWADVRRRLPPYSTVPAGGAGRRIALWQGMDLIQSHRHHSHLAALWPFRTVDPFDPQHRETVANSLKRWAHMGAGEWTGWCIPWASILCSRCGQPDAALLWLKWWRHLYTNEGHGTLHNADFPGCAARDDGALEQAGFRKPEPFPHEIMQMDAGMAAVSAIVEMLVQCRGDELWVLPWLPKRWRELRFDGIRAEGAFLVGATVREACVDEIRITSLAGAPLCLVHTLGAGWTVDGRPSEGAVLRQPTRRGQVIVVRRGTREGKFDEK